MKKKTKELPPVKYDRPTPATAGNLRPIVPCIPIAFPEVFNNCQKDYGMAVTTRLWRSHPEFEDWFTERTF